MSLLHDFERRVDAMLRGLFSTQSEPGQGKELIEIQRAILDALSDRVQNLPRARRVFPFNDVTVRIPYGEAERRAALEMVFAADALRADIVEHLRRDAVEFPPDLQAHVELHQTAELTDPQVVCAKREAPADEAAHQATRTPPTVRFIPVGGTAVEVTRPRIHVGRVAEVFDDKRRLVRRNDVAIEHSTVSRAHAHLEYDPAAGEFRLFDDGSSYGTSVSHEGRLVDVPKAGGRGLRLYSGDEIYFGQLRASFEILS